jgi:uncharacterized membrane protein
MPAPLTPLGVFHTAFGLAALFCGFFSLVRYKEISPRNRFGQIYVVTTFITAVTALGIYQHGGFGFQHVLAILTLVGLATGILAMLTGVFGAASRYVQAISFSTTIFLHLLPGVTEALTRIPPGNPLVTSYSAPALKVALFLVLMAFLVGLTLQIRWLRTTQGLGGT